MKSSKQIKLIAKEMFKRSLENTKIDSQKVKAVLNEFYNQKEAKAAKILKIYKNLVSQALSWQEVIVETALDTIGDDQKRSILAKTEAQSVKVVKNPKIVAGAKIYHGDWVYDETLEGKLNLLTVNR